MHAIVQRNYGWLRPHIVGSIQQRCPKTTFIDSVNDLPDSGARLLHFSSDSNVHMEYFRNNSLTSAVNWYPIDQSLVDKDRLPWLIKHRVSKSSNGALAEQVPETHCFWIDDSDTVDEALHDAEAYELRASLRRNEHKSPEGQEWWLLKPAVLCCGKGIKLFATGKDLEESLDPDLSDLRNHRRFVCQRYIQDPLLLQPESRKFHIRTYALAVGSLEVHVFRRMLALFAPKRYQSPWESASSSIHLTNTSLQGSSIANGSIRVFEDLEDDGRIGQDWKNSVFSQIRDITSDAFGAAAQCSPTTFQLLSNCFQLFGIDFLVDQAGKVWLLEFNSGPALDDLDDTKALLVDLFDSIVDIAMGHWFRATECRSETMVKVLDLVEPRA